MDRRWHGGGELPDRLKRLASKAKHRARRASRAQRIAVVGGMTGMVLIISVAATALAQPSDEDNSGNGSGRYPYAYDAPVLEGDDGNAGGADPSGSSSSGSPSSSSSSPGSKDSKDDKNDDGGGDTNGGGNNGGGDPTGGGSDVDYPSSGTYEVTANHSSHCLGLNGEVLIQDVCFEADPRPTLSSNGDGTYQITMGSSGCLGAATSGSGSKLDTSDCGGPRQTFRLVPVGSQWQIQVTATGQCIDFSSSGEGTEATTAGCNSGKSSQQFRIG